MNGFVLTNGAKERSDRLVRIGREKFMLIYGYGTDGENGYDWRKVYTHNPTVEELKVDIETLINSQTDKSILNGFIWQGKNIYLSTANQMNFNAAYLLSETTNGSNLPVTFKVGEQEGKPVYHTFETSSELALFYNSLVAHINSCVKKGWGEKDSVDYESIINSIKK